MPIYLNFSSISLHIPRYLRPRHREDEDEEAASREDHGVLAVLLIDHHGLVIQTELGHTEQDAGVG